MATATDDNAEIRNLDARLFEKSTCRHTSSESVQTPVQSVPGSEGLHICLLASGIC